MTSVSVIEAAAAIRDGRVSACELVDDALARANASQSILNAFCHLDAEGAIVAARECDRAIAAGRDLGPLAGVPFGVKDLEHCAGMPTTRGSRWFQGEPAVDRDDIHVARLRSAGAIPIGKTTTPEFGTFAYTASPALGVTRNPWDPTRTPGGSSGGTAAAVSASVIPFGTASDGGGSIRAPAGFCGLPGLKPTYGRIPGIGLTNLAQNATVGALATTVGDTALLLDVMAGPDRRDRTCLPASTIRYTEVIDTLDIEGLRIAFSSDLGFAIVDPEVAAISEAAMRALARAARLDTIAIDIRFDDFVRVYSRIEGADMWIDIPPGRYPERADELDPRVRRGWDAASRATLPKFAAVYRQRRAIEEQVAAIFDEIDVLITPTTTIPAFAAEGPMPTEINGQSTHAGMATPFTMLANLTNLPSISLPAGSTRTGLPVGFMLTADRFREDVCLRLARIFEQTNPWPRHAPYPG